MASVSDPTHICIYDEAAGSDLAILCLQVWVTMSQMVLNALGMQCSGSGSAGSC